MIRDWTAGSFDEQVDGQFLAVQVRVSCIRSEMTMIVQGKRPAGIGRRDQFEGVTLKLLTGRNRYVSSTAERHRAKGTWDDVSRTALPRDSD